jgi:hypothetical protein
MNSTHQAASSACIACRGLLLRSLACSLPLAISAAAEVLLLVLQVTRVTGFVHLLLLSVKSAAALCHGC